MKWLEILISQEQGSEDIPLPEYQSEHAAGADIRAAVERPVILEPGMIKLIPTGLRMAIPQGYEGQVRPRSGLALKHGIGILNSPGTIDSDYRGPVGIILYNAGAENFVIHRGDRIAQLVIAKHEQAMFKLKENLENSRRGEAGFGSTGR